MTQKLKTNLWAAACTGLLLAATGLGANAFAAPTFDASGTISSKAVYDVGPNAHGVTVTAPPVGGTGIPAYGPILYHAGGSIMPKVSKVVLIWYGNWDQHNGTDTPEGQKIIREFLYGLAAAPSDDDDRPDSDDRKLTNYPGITTGARSSLGVFTQTNPSAVVRDVSSFDVREVFQPASATYGGVNINDYSIWDLSLAAAGAHPDPNAIYFVLTSSEVNETTGFLTRYCGWHSYGTTNSGVDIKVGFIGNPNRLLAACNVNAPGVSPNGNPGVDAMASVIAHELEETVTDPLLNAWYSRWGYETGDLCAWTFGGSQKRIVNGGTKTTGAYYNVTLPSHDGDRRKYLLQRALAPNSKCYVNATGQVQ